MDLLLMSKIWKLLSIFAAPTDSLFVFRQHEYVGPLHIQCGPFSSCMQSKVSQPLQI